MHVRTVVGMSIIAAAAVAVAGCSDQKPLQPTGTSASAAIVPGNTGDTAVNAPQGGPPGYEPAYYDGQTVTINAIELAQHAPDQAQADFYEVVYPIDWQDLGLPPPQCNPCDHQGNGIDFTDYHDHVLDSIPSNPGHGEYRALWHVYVIVPAYNNDPAHDAALDQAYAASLPLTSEAAIDNLLGQTLPDGSPIVVEVDAQFYFLCAVVNGHAAH